MSPATSWITHKGKKILYIDLFDLEGEQYLAALDEAKEVYRTLERQSTLVLIDATDSVSSSETTERQRQLAAMKVAKHAAVVGVTGIKRMIAKAVRKDFYFAKSLADGKEWLINQP